MRDTQIHNLFHNSYARLHFSYKNFHKFPHIFLVEIHNQLICFIICTRDCKVINFSKKNLTKKNGLYL